MGEKPDVVAIDDLHYERDKGKFSDGL